jgi:phosphate starvation-inducible protein PhoH and related proteins
VPSYFLRKIFLVFSQIYLTNIYIKNLFAFKKGDYARNLFLRYSANKRFLYKHTLKERNSMEENYNLKFPNNEYFNIILGAGDRNLDLLEEITMTKIFIKSENVIIKTNKSSVEEERIEIFFKALIEIARYNKVLTERDIVYIFNQCTNENSCRDIVEIYIHKTLIAKVGMKSIYAKSTNQKKYFEAIKNNDVIFGIGPAGTGKTFIPIIDAAYQLRTNKIKKIILTRPIVEAEEKIGFLPGDMKDKVDPYLIPLYDGLMEIFNKEEIDKMMEMGIIEIAPLAFMRGRTLENAYIILDEAQNTTKGQMKLFLTRLGFNSKMVITGDITQVDLPRHVKSGLRQAIETLRHVKNVSVIEFDSTDIVRHPIVQEIVENFDNYEWVERK